MLQSDHRPVRSLRAVPTAVPPTGAESSTVEGRLSPIALAHLRQSLPDTLTSNKRAVINRLIALYEQQAIG